jgi:hypothetical protein
VPAEKLREADGRSKPEVFPHAVDMWLPESGLAPLGQKTRKAAEVLLLMPVF